MPPGCLGVLRAGPRVLIRRETWQATPPPALEAGARAPEERRGGARKRTLICLVFPRSRPWYAAAQVSPPASPEGGEAAALWMWKYPAGFFPRLLTEAPACVGWAGSHLGIDADGLRAPQSARSEEAGAVVVRDGPAPPGALNRDGSR